MAEREIDRHFERKVLRLLHEILCEIRGEQPPAVFTVQIASIQENAMSTTPIIVQGTPASFFASLLENGSPYVAPAGSTYVPSYTWSASDPGLLLTPSSDTTSVSITDPTSDTATTATLGVSTVAPDGSTATGTLVVTLQPGVANVFSVNIAPSAAQSPAAGASFRTTPASMAKYR
jgi:hypothetical protein